MSPSTPFIKRPVATALLMLAIVLAGLVGFRLLPLAALPQVDFPTIQVQTLYPGASPEVMGQTVTAPLERQFGQMAGLQRMSSTSAAGVSIITLQFTLGQTLDVAEQEVQAAINAGGSLLPTDLPAPPVYAKVNPADAPVLTLAITSDTMPLTQVQNIVNTRLALKISQVSGVGLVSLSGGQRPAVRIQGDTKLLASYGLGLDSLRTAIAAANVNSAKGSFDGPTRSFTINANDQLVTADDYKRLIITYKNGAPVRLSDVASVVDSAENTRLGAWAGKQPAIILNVQRQPGANVIKTVDAIKALLPELQTSLPAAMKLDVLSDRTTGIRASVDRRELELANNGFMPLVHCKNSSVAAFIGAQSLHSPQQYDDPDATANARLAARLPYLFATCRFAHYLKCIVRDKIGSFKERAEIENWLNGWINQYVDLNPATATDADKARKPLAAAEVVVEEDEGNPGFYRAKFFLRPHYQLEGLTVSLRLVSKLPSVKA